MCLGRTGKELCPVNAIAAYMVIRGEDTWALLPVCIRVHAVLVQRLRTALVGAGYVAADYAGHSFRSGAATTAAMAEMIQRQ